MEWNKVMNFGDPSTFGTEMADRFVASGANLPPPVSNRVKGQSNDHTWRHEHTVIKKTIPNIVFKRFQQEEANTKMSISRCQ